MAAWFFELVGDAADLEQMAKLFEVGAVQVVKRDDGKFWMRSADLDAIIDHRDAREVAEPALKMLNGISGLRVANTGRASLGSAVHVDDAGKLNIVVFVTGIAATTRTGMVGVLIDGKPVPPKEDAILTIALRYPAVDQVLRLYGSREPDWRDLYFILTAVEAEIGGKVSKRGWISDKERTRFTRTANSKHAIGDFARHGEDIPAPDHPYTLPDARQLIRGIVERWIQEKMGT